MDEQFQEEFSLPELVGSSTKAKAKITPLLVENLSLSVTYLEMKTLFNQFGKVKTFSVTCENGKENLQAFVRYVHPDDVQNALVNLQNFKLRGLELRVSQSFTRSQKFSHYSISAPKRKQATHFVCLTFLEPSILEHLQRLQDSIVQRYSLPDEVRVNVNPDFHISLLILSVPDQASVELVSRKLKNFQVPPSVYVDIKNSTGTFGDRVLWIKPQFEPTQLLTLNQWRETLKSELKDFELRPEESWTPHGTIIKSRSMKFPVDIKDYASIAFGEQSYEFLQTKICFLSCQKDDNGRYHRIHELSGSCDNSDIL